MGICGSLLPIKIPVIQIGSSYPDWSVQTLQLCKLDKHSYEHFNIYIKHEPVRCQYILKSILAYDVWMLVKV